MPKKSKKAEDRAQTKTSFDDFDLDERLLKVDILIFSSLYIL